jgi:hypothetical protein
VVAADRAETQGTSLVKMISAWWWQRCFFPNKFGLMIPNDEHHLQSGWWFGTCFIFLYIRKNHPD